jgi:hypothetical protein
MKPFLFLLATTAFAQLPNPKLTPGATLKVTTKQVCEVGYSSHARAVSLSSKKYVFRLYGIPWSTHAQYEVDHLISLELAGANTVNNLWPEPYAGQMGAKVKDRLENRLHRMVCAGQIPLEQAQREMATDWQAAYWKYVK